jgi:nucleotide-binding universal stress UspA family protein
MEVRLMKILVALDESQHSERALEFVTRMRWPAGSTIVVLCVAQPIPAGLATAYEPQALLNEVTEVQQARLRETVARAERVLRESGLSTVGRVYTGDPRAALIEATEKERADLLVVGSHGRAGLAKLMLGSVSSHAVTHAPCSVLVVKGGRPAGHPSGGTS